MIKRFLFPLILLLISLISAGQNNFYARLAEAAMKLDDPTVIYDGRYVSIGYPNGDVPSNRGVCTDLVIRTYRSLGIDLQKEVHEDMRLNFSEYPYIWGLTSTDRNIDHRRVPNLMKFFSRHGETMPISNDPNSYKPGSIVCWNLGGGLTHIGVVVNEKSEDGERYLIMHNIGGGQVLADCLFEFEIIGHYRYGGD